MDESFDLTYKVLFRKYYPSLALYATRLAGEGEVEDVVQDVFVELWKQRGSIEIGEQTQAFLYHVIYACALSVLKRRNVEGSYCTVVEEINRKCVESYQSDNGEAIRKIEDRELRKGTHDTINELPSKCKEVFKLNYLYNIKNREIADVLGVSLRTVEVHTYKALEFLRNHLGHLWFILLLFLLD